MVCKLRWRILKDYGFVCWVGSILWVMFSLIYFWNMSGPVRLSQLSHQAAKRLLGITTFSQNTSRHLPHSQTFDYSTDGTAYASNPVWCPNVTKDLFYDTDEDYLIPKLQQLGFRVSKGLGTRHQRAGTDFERCLMSTPPLKDVRRAPSEFRSKVFMVSPKPHYKIGDVIQFRVDLFDGYGKPRTSGGDEVRMRLVSKPGTGTTSIAANVVDMGNGSYVGTTLLPWKGKASVEVSLAYPREFLREAVRLRLTIHCTKWIAAEFESGTIQERTGCLPSAPIPGYAAVCNMTEYNGGLAYHCGRPTNKNLNCSHRKYFRVFNPLLPLPIPAAEQKLIKMFDRKPFLHLIPNKISISVLPGTTKWPSDLLPSCWKITPNATWYSRAPRGWMDEGGMWRSLTCALPATVHVEHVQKCLRNTTVALVGDSNMRHMWCELRRYLRCSREELGHMHRHKLCEVQSSNTTLKWAFHGRPTYTYYTSDNVPLPLALEDLRHHIRHLHRRVILVLHYNLHFTSLSPAVYMDRVKAAKHHLGNFLRESPEAKVLIRGPHVVASGTELLHIKSGDLFGPAYTQIWHREFRELRDRVWFLDFWDMTVATQNIHTHPPPSVLREIVKVMLGYVCENLK